LERVYFAEGLSQVISRASQALQRRGYAGFAIAGALVACAWIGAVSDSPSAKSKASWNREYGVSAATSEVSRLFAPAIGKESRAPSAANLSSRNLQLPRLPRHRSERPSLGVTDAEAVTALAVKAMIGDDVHRPFIVDGSGACPLAGHPLSILRPPSLSA